MSHELAQLLLKEPNREILVGLSNRRCVEIERVEYQGVNELDMRQNAKPFNVIVIKKEKQ